MTRYDTIRHVTSLAAKLACYACVLPGPAFMSIHPSVHLPISLCFCRACGRVSLSVPACACMRVCLCVRVCMVCSPCKSICMHMYVCMYVCMYACICLRIRIWISTYVCRSVSVFDAQPASQKAKKKRSPGHTLRTLYEHVPYRAPHTHYTIHRSLCANND